ncbi:hypothetical protein [Paractinoplanes atraurantiacus]|uniref:Uncharacterized protein n=1 Tax=Paractinoplanes atraurantiacus TaxID=1036182 RepID=A0A285KJV9_9ACTN|nr:hypothetical protein [Actinoplanes atraurantiacus]SNY72919.1 hypothetical protein SAMN05421748_14458 [Actinoplanes atraurantiacus]
MPYADILTVIHHDDARTDYTDARYQLHRGGVRVWTTDGETVHTDVLMTQAYRAPRTGQNAGVQ